MTSPAKTVAVVGAMGAGKALHLARLGVATRLVVLPDEPDVPGRDILEGSGVVVVNQPSEVPPTGLVPEADIVIAALTRSVHPFLPALGANGRLWVDLASWDGRPSELHDPFVDAGSCLFLSDIELDDTLGTAERLVPGKELVVVTHGKRGATAFFPDTEPFFVLPHDTGPAVGTDGVRDAFCSGTTFGIARGWAWPRALRAGSVAAGGCVAVPTPVDPALTAEWLTSRV